MAKPAGRQRSSDAPQTLSSEAADIWLAEARRLPLPATAGCARVIALATGQIGLPR